MKRFLFVAFLLLCSAVAGAQNIDIDIYSINDFHGALVADGKNPGIARIAAYLDAEKNRNSDGTVILAAGDMFQGSLESNVLRGMSVVEQMNLLGFDAACVGNHEFDWGQQTLRRNIDASHFPWLGANVIDVANGGVFPPLRPYTVIERKGIKIGIIGLCTPTTPLATNPKNVDGLYFSGVMAPAMRYIERLKQQNVDIILLLTHLDSNEKTGAADGEFRDIADLLADNSHVAAIITGHSHAYVNNEVDGIPVMQAGEYGRAVAKLQLVFDTESREVVGSNREIVRLDAEPWNELPPDKQSMQLLSQSLSKVTSLRNMVIGTAVKPLTHNPAPLRPTIFGEYMCDAILAAVDADICLLSSGSIRKGLPVGAIDYGNFYQAMPIDITMYTLDMYGRDIKSVLEYGINHPNINIIQWSGMTVVYDARKPYGKAVDKILLKNGVTIDENKRYRVVTSDFMVNGLGGFAMAGINGRNTGILCRDMVERAIEQQKAVDFIGDGRFMLIKSNTLVETPLG